MVTIKNAHQRNADGKSFITLELMGGLELVQSQRSGRFYATSKRCFIGSTFTLEQARLFIGQKMPGLIIRISSEPYEYTIPESGEVITLSHTYAYQPEEQLQEQPDKRLEERPNVFEEMISGM